MFQQLKLDMKLNKSECLTLPLIELGSFLFGLVLISIVMRLDDDSDSWFCMGTLMALFASVFSLAFMGGFGYSNEFQVAVSMGRTRGAFMGSYAVRLLLQIFLGYIVVLALYRLELAAYPLLFPECENEVAFTFLTNWKIVVPCVLGLLILTMFLGAIYGRYGKQGLWVFYFIWLFSCFILPRVFDEDPGSGMLDKAAIGIRTVFSTVPPTVWIAFGGVLAVGMAATTVTLGKKQMVKL